MRKRGKRPKGAAAAVICDAQPMDIDPQGFELRNPRSEEGDSGEEQDNRSDRRQAPYAADRGAHAACSRQ